MLENALIILSLLAFVLLWWLAGKYADLPAQFLNQLRLQVETMKYELLEVLPVYSAETVAGKEAEFVDHQPYDRRRIIYGIRAILIICFLSMAYLFWKN